MNRKKILQKIDEDIKSGKLITADQLHEENMKDPEYRKGWEKTYKEFSEEIRREIMEETAQEIKQARLSAGVTQAELAKKLKTTRSYISAIESGRQNVSVEYLVKVAAALKRQVRVEIL